MHHMMKGGPRGARRQKPLLLFPPFALRRHQKLYLINPPIPSTRQPTNQHPLSPFVIRAKKKQGLVFNLCFSLKILTCLLKLQIQLSLSPPFLPFSPLDTDEFETGLLPWRIPLEKTKAQNLTTVTYHRYCPRD